MHETYKVTFWSLLCVSIAAFFYTIARQDEIRKKCMVTTIKTEHDIMPVLFPCSADDIKKRTTEYLSEAKERIDFILSIGQHDHTYANTVRALDRIMKFSNLALWANVMEFLEQVSTDEHIRGAAHAAIQEIQSFFVDYVTNNRQLYEAFVNYEQYRPWWDQHTPEKDYALKEFFDMFYRAGVNLPEEKRAQVRALQKEVDNLCLEFSINIAADQSCICVAREELAGVNEDIINGLIQENGLYRVGVDYPTYFAVMESCTNEETRRRLYIAFNQRAWPVNQDVLNKLRQKRHELAQIIGFKSFAHLDLDSKMAKTPETVHEFLGTLFTRSLPKMQEEYALLKDNLPTGVSLTADGKIKPWDFAFIKEHYKRTHCAVDEQLVSEYFPLQQTIDGLLEIYKAFFSIEFEQVSCQTWHADVRVLKVYSHDRNTFYGYIFLDLHPRPHKFSHAAFFTIVPALRLEDGFDVPAIGAVVANFPKPAADKPALLKRDDVRTFFHEFGHALHGLFGKTSMATLSGTSTRRDFVEMPSQILEEWLWDAEILQGLGRHYKTGQSMPTELVRSIIALKNFDSGFWTVRQVVLSLYSLTLYEQSAEDLHVLLQTMYERYLPNIYFEPTNHHYASFGHLTEYAASYYGYLWAKIYALDLFYVIKEHGLLDYRIGERYRQQVLEPGGSCEPADMLQTFLGRPPTTDAFFTDMGLAQPCSVALEAVPVDQEVLQTL